MNFLLQNVVLAVMGVQVSNNDIIYYNLSIGNITPSEFIDITFNQPYFKDLEDIKELIKK